MCENYSSCSSQPFFHHLSRMNLDIVINLIVRISNRDWVLRTLAQMLAKLFQSLFKKVMFRNVSVSKSLFIENAGQPASNAYSNPV